ncbi:MAG: Rdx family protein [Desulfobulbaceae bacterium]|nr:Rdx family protein [Desulfobulbaceae bacterium]
MRRRFDADIELVASSGGVFEVTVDGQLVFSKKKLGRFPEAEELAALLGGKK